MEIWFTSSVWSFTDEQTHLFIHSTWNKPYHIHFSIRNVHQKYLHEGNRNSKLSEYRSRKFHQKGLTVVSLETRYYYAMQSEHTVLFSAKKIVLCWEGHWFSTGKEHDRSLHWKLFLPEAFRDTCTILRLHNNHTSLKRLWCLNTELVTCEPSSTGCFINAPSIIFACAVGEFFQGKEVEIS